MQVAITPPATKGLQICPEGAQILPYSEQTVIQAISWNSKKHYEDTGKEPAHGEYLLTSIVIEVEKEFQAYNDEVSNVFLIHIRAFSVYCHATG